MDLPQPPDDIDLKNIIDKLANFVARNGPDFERMTKEKQKDNPKFGFLFGGPNFNYYQFRVTTEQAIIKNQQMKQQQHQSPVMPAFSSAPPAGWTAPGQMPAAPPPPAVVQPPVQVPQVNSAQIQAMQEQIKQSELNLAAQYQTMTQQQQLQVEDHMRVKREDRLRRLCTELSISRDELDNIVQPIIEACTKDAISNGKNWIFNHCNTDKHCELIAHYLLMRVIQSDKGAFTLRLHLIYLINDVLHHCTRKNAEGLKQAIEKVILGIFSTTHHTVGIEPAHQQKLQKLLSLWSNNNYFSVAVLTGLKDPATALEAFKRANEAEHQGFINVVSAATQQQYNKLQKQHLDFVNHINTQIQNLQQQAAQAAQQAALMPPVVQHNIKIPPPNFDPTQPPPSMNVGPPPPIQPDWSGGAGSQSSGTGFPEFDPARPPPMFDNPNQMPPLVPPQPMDLTPNVPYYELPAGLMAPLVKLEDCDYESLDPKIMRLPPPMPPSERLLAAVEAFYAQPTHERPRDSEGWEKLGLYEFFRAKQKAKKQLEENGGVVKKPKEEISPVRSESASPPPESKKRRRKFDSERDRLKRSRSRSRSLGRSGSNSGSRSRSRTRSPLKASSRSPRNRRSKSRDGSRSRSRSPIKPRIRSRSRSPVKHRRRSKSRSATPEFTSARFPISAPVSLDTKLGEDNKGAMLMKKMGWGGGGLGQAEQGRVEPIAPGEVRDRSDMFKGIGVGSDPFEQFRKNQSQGFIQRMKARAPASEDEKKPKRQSKNVPID